MYVSVRLLTLKISQWARENLYSYRKINHWNTWLIALKGSLSNISSTRECFIGYPRNEKRVENKMRSGVFLTKFKVFEYPMNTVSRLWYVFSIETKCKWSKGKSKIVKIYCNQLSPGIQISLTFVIVFVITSLRT